MNKQLRVFTIRKLKITKSELSKNQILIIISDFLKMVNYGFYLHPEVETKEHYVTDILQKKFPNYDFYINKKTNTIQINL